jgi:tetratricopeptide (TPR) repeat protein
MHREIRVFISSTFRDMQAERDELAKFVFPEMRRLCQERGVTWTSVDLRWGIAEEDANRVGVLSLCLDEIQRCRPFFTGILGERYGWIPEQVDCQLLESEPWLSGLDRCSITELEILHGVLNNPEMKGHAFFYFRDPAYLETLPHDLRESYREQDGTESARKLSDLKARIRASGFPLVENYPDPRTLGEHIKQDLRRVLDALFPVGTEPSPLERERVEQEASAATRSRGFIARPEAFERLDRHVNGSEPPLTVLGESGSGKSALLANWVKQRREEHPDEFTFMHVCGSTAASVDWAAMLRRCIAELQIHCDVQEKIADDHDELRVQFANWLSMGASGSRLVVVFDALDQLEDRQGALDLVWLPERPPENLRVILSTLPGRPLESIHKRGWPTFELDLLNIRERKQITETYLSLFRKKLSATHLNRIIQASHTANPLFLRTLLDELRLFGEYGRLGQRIDEYLAAESIERLFEMILTRYEEDYNRDRPNLVQDAFSYIFLARRGLTESELLDLLSEKDDPLPHAYWSPLHLAIEPSLVNRNGLIGFFHSYLRAAVKRRYLASPDERWSVHSRLAEYFETRALDTRKVEELPWQYMQTRSWGQLAACIGDPEFFQVGWDQAEFDMRMYWAQLMEQSKYTPQETYQTILGAPSAFFETLGSVAQLLSSIGGYDEALVFQTARIEVARKTDRPYDYAKALQWKAMILEKRGDHAQAMRIYRALEQVYRDVHDDRSLAEVLNSQASILRIQGDLRGALNLHAQQEKIGRDLNDRRMLSEVFHNQGTVLFAKGELEEAMMRFEESERIVREMGDRMRLSDCYSARAAVLLKRGDLESTLIELGRAEDVHRMIGDRAKLKVTLGTRATTLRMMRRLDEALTLYKEQEQICRELDDNETLAVSLNGQGLVHKQQGDLEAALALFEESESVSRELAALQSLQAALGNQASIHHQQGQMDRALSIREEEIEICRRAGYQEDLAYALFTKSELLYDLRCYEEALPAAREAYELAQELGLEKMIKDLENKWFPQ